MKRNETIINDNKCVLYSLSCIEFAAEPSQRRGEYKIPFRSDLWIANSKVYYATDSNTLTKIVLRPDPNAEAGPIHKLDRIHTRIVTHAHVIGLT